MAWPDACHVKPRARSRSTRKPSSGTRRIKLRGSSDDNRKGTRPAGFELSELRQLIRLVQRTGIGELEVSSGGRTVRVSAQPGMASPLAGPVLAASAAATSATTAGSAPAAGESPKAAEHLVAITSPMVGTFYRAPAPDADPYVEPGALIEVGQTVCIIEAMKLMNEIESEVKGRIVQILVENAQPVEFGQKLFMVEPA